MNDNRVILPAQAPPLPITLDRITVRVRDRWIFKGLSWKIRQGEHWVVIGANGAGKTTLVKALAGLLPVVQGSIYRHETDKGATPDQAISYVAGDARRNLWKKEQELAFARDFSGNGVAVTRVRDLFPAHFPPAPESSGRHPDTPAETPADTQEPRPADIIRWCGIESLLDRPVLSISSGEMSRVQIARELFCGPRLLILDEPFEGLDDQARKELIRLLNHLTQAGLSLVLVTHRREEIPPVMTHLLVLDNEKIKWQGLIQKAPASVFSGFTVPSPKPPACRKTPFSPSCPHAPLIDMHSVSVRYDGRRVVSNLTWSVLEGQHWLITGPNGAGKSTLLSLLTGECQQVHANRVRILGHERGPDFPLEAVRNCMGVVNAGLVTGYQKPVSVKDVVVSGLFDSVGLYVRPDVNQMKTAEKWIRQLNLEALENAVFTHLSQGQRQMVLIARAMVKTPRILILDEPLTGLDARNRAGIQTLLEDIAASGDTTILLVSHNAGDIPRCITHHLALDQGHVRYQGPI